MGRSTKKIVILYCVIIAAWLPLSVVAASIDCIFHESNAFKIENSFETSSHESFIDLSDIDFTEEFEQTTQDSGCSTQLIVVAIADSEATSKSLWKSNLDLENKAYQITAVLLPRDIRPPISI